MLETPMKNSFDQSVKLKELGQSAGKLKSLAYLVGVYLGDGYAAYVPQNRSFVFALNTIDEDFAITTMEAIYDLLGKKARICRTPARPPRQLVHRVAVNSKDLVLFLKQETLNKIIIPQFIWKADKEAQRAFIAGIMDSEGWMAICTQNGFTAYQLGIAGTEPWVKELPDFFGKFGLKCGPIKPMKVKRNEKPKVRVLINKISWISNKCYFNIKRKQSRIQKYDETLSDYWRRRQISIPQRLHARPINGKI